MRSLFYPLIYLCVFTHASYAQTWDVEWENPLPQGNPIYAMAFSDTLHGWAVSGSETSAGIDISNILKTVNGGELWELQTTQSGVILYDIHFINSEIGWGVGKPDVILKTTNGGTEWVSITPPQQALQWNQIEFVTPEIGWLSGKASEHTGYFFKTTDAGQTWERQAINTQINHFYFRDQAMGWVLSRSDSLYHTSDGGATWFGVSIGETNNTYTWHDLAYISPDTLIVSGYQSTSFSGIITRTTNGGTDWENYFTEESITGLHYDPVTAQARATTYDPSSGEGMILFSSDYGNTWQDEPFRCAASLGDFIQFEHRIWLYGDFGYIARYFDGEWITQTPGSRDHLYDLETYNDYGWAVGGRPTGLNSVNGVILHKPVGTNAWHIQKNVPNLRVPLWSVDVVDEDHVWVVGDSVWATTDGGETWQTQTYHYASFTGIDMIDTNYGWVVGVEFDLPNTYPIALKTVNGGRYWHSFRFTEISGGFREVTFIDSLHGWVVGTNGMIFKTIDGGENWTTQSCGTANHLFSVQFVDSQHGWISDQVSNGIYRTDDGGETWAFIPQPLPEANVTDFQFLDTQHGFTSGRRVRQTTDGGSTWQTIDLELGQSQFEGVFATESSHFRICGLGGRIYNFEFDVMPVKTSDPQPLTPKSCVLHQNYPNPFNPTTTIRFDLPQADKISLNVYDLSGKLVQNLVDHQPYPAGTHQIEWDASDLSSGVYIYQLETLNSKLKTQKAVVLK